MKTIGAFDAKTHLSRRLDEVANGETYVITTRGTPVARLLPPVEADDREEAEGRDIVKEWEEYRRAHSITLGGDITIREMIEDGRKY